MATDSVLMTGASSWAFVDPIRTLTGHHDQSLLMMGLTGLPSTGFRGF
jgi:hypothetical protein